MREIKTQKDAVLNHLEEHGSITSMEAIQNYGATRLSAIIFNLRYKDGYDIETHMETAKNRYGRSVDYARYVLGGFKHE